MPSLKDRMRHLFRGEERTARVNDEEEPAPPSTHEPTLHSDAGATSPLPDPRREAPVAGPSDADPASPKAGAGARRPADPSAPEPLAAFGRDPHPPTDEASAFPFDPFDVPVEHPTDRFFGGRDPSPRPSPAPPTSAASPPPPAPHPADGGTDADAAALASPIPEPAEPGGVDAAPNPVHDDPRPVDPRATMPDVPPPAPIVAPGDDATDPLADGHGPADAEASDPGPTHDPGTERGGWAAPSATASDLADPPATEAVPDSDLPTDDAFAFVAPVAETPRPAPPAFEPAFDPAWAPPEPPPVWHGASRRPAVDPLDAPDDDARLAGIADDLLAQGQLNDDGTRLAEILAETDHGSRRARLRALIADGAEEDVIYVAWHVRTTWNDKHSYWTGLQLGWFEAYRIADAFHGYPDADEVVAALEPLVHAFRHARRRFDRYEGSFQTFLVEVLDADFANAPAGDDLVHRLGLRTVAP